MQSIKDGSYVVNDINPSKFYLGKTPLNQGQCKYVAYSLWCKQDLRLRGVIGFCLPPVNVHSAFIPNSRNIRPVHHCKIIDKGKKVREGSRICPGTTGTCDFHF